MAAPSVRVENRIHNAKQIIHSVELHGPRVAPLLAQKLNGMTEAEALKVLRSLARTLEKATTQLEQAEKAYVEEQSDDARERDERDDALNKAAEGLQMVRHTLNSIQPDGELLKQFGLPRDIPSRPTQLQAVLSNAGNLLQKSSEVFKSTLGVQVIAKDIGNFIGNLASTLSKELNDVQREEVQLQAALMDRNRAMDEWGLLYRNIGSSLEAFYRLAGFEELANRIRPTAKKRRGEVAEEQELEDPALSTPSVPPADPPTEPPTDTTD